MTDPLLEVKNISLSRNDNPILSNINLEVNISSVINIHGRNGCGKTSLLKIIVGITEPTSGEINNNILSDDNKNITYIGHKHGIKNNLTLSENILFEPSIYHDKQKNIDHMINRYQMDKYKDYLSKNLSHGQQKKISLIKASLSNAKVWVIDEPYSALDKDAIKILDSCINEHLSNQGSVIMTNHEPITDKEYKVVNFKVDCE
jgi:heme exporter protein A